MPNLKFIVLAITTHSLLILSAKADTGFSFDPPILKGSGCPDGSTSVVMTPDQTTLSILFSQFEAKVPQTTGQNDNDVISEDNPTRGNRFNSQLDHKVCLMLIGANLPQGTMMDSFEVSLDFRGNTYVERGSRATMRTYFVQKQGLGGDHRPRTLVENRQWIGADSGHSEDWTIQTRKSIPLPSHCARNNDRKIYLSLKNILRAIIGREDPRMRPLTPAGGPQATITLDSTDVIGMMKFKFNVKPCRRD